MVTLFERKEVFNKLFEKFIIHLKELRGVQPPFPDFDSLEKDEIWAIGQNYGLPTPLLDWTEEPYIAS